MTAPTPRDVTATEDLVLRNAVKRASKLIPHPDTARLDWIEQTEMRGLELPEYIPTHGNPQTPWHLCIDGAWRYFPTLRSVIDAAIAHSGDGSPLGSGARPDQPKLPESGGGSSIGLGAEGEQ